MQIEIRKLISEYKKGKWGFLLTVLEKPEILICLVIFLLLLVCESYYKNKTSAEHTTTFIGGIFSVFGFVLLWSAWVTAYRHRKRYKNQLMPTSEYYVSLSNVGCERGVKDFWIENNNWRMLIGYRETKSAFHLDYGTRGFVIPKADFKTPEAIEEFRGFLKKKFVRA